MASSTSKNNGRCRRGSNVRCPGRTSRSSQVASARHERAAAGTRTATLAPRRAPSSTAAAARPRPATGRGGVFRDAGRARRHRDPERRQRRHVLEHAEATRGHLPPGHQGFDAHRGHRADRRRRMRRAPDSRRCPGPEKRADDRACRRVRASSSPNMSDTPRPMRSSRHSSIRLRSSSARVRSRRCGAITAFHSTTVTVAGCRTRRGDSRREKNLRHWYQGTGAHALHRQRLPRQSAGELPGDVLRQSGVGQGGQVGVPVEHAVLALDPGVDERRPRSSRAQAAEEPPLLLSEADHAGLVDLVDEPRQGRQRDGVDVDPHAAVALQHARTRRSPSGSSGPAGPPTVRRRGRGASSACPGATGRGIPRGRRGAPASRGTGRDTQSASGGGRPPNRPTPPGRRRSSGRCEQGGR